MSSIYAQQIILNNKLFLNIQHFSFIFVKIHS